MYFVYILKNKENNKFYTGCTKNLDERIKKHNDGKIFWSKRYKPWSLHYSEKFIDKIKAYKREKYLKSHAGRNWIKKKIKGL